MPLISGYAFQCASPDKWKSCPDDDWTTVVMKGAGGKFLGFRSIDGTKVTVWSKGKNVYAQTVACAKPPRGLT